ncbi:hypothetical protein DRO66_00500 [Candidatus Bathyarchaeota archaeon]|nr:MAG: hypothetical protein DRO66_00500 [Candidatus Bathyarchaeota archaeon]
MSDSSKLKMYILVKEGMSTGQAMTSVAHAGAMMEKSFGHEGIMQEWYDHSFKKVICEVDLAQFEKAKGYGTFFTVTESCLEGKEVVLVCEPREEWPGFFNFLKLYNR